MRTLDLLKGFTPIEIKELEKTVSENKRPTLALLFKELKKLTGSEEEPDNATLFKKVFAKTYSKDQDYLLRNELRLLNKIIYDHLLMVTFLEETKRTRSTYDQWLMKGLFNRKVKSLFEADIDKSIKTAQEDNRPADTSQMYYYKSVWLIQNLPRSAENLKGHIALLAEYKKEEERRFLHRMREIESQTAYLQYELDFLQNPDDMLQREDRRTKGQTNFDLSELAQEDWYARYLEIKKHVFQTNHQLNIDVLKQKIAIENSPEHSSFFTYDNRLFTLGHLAHELMRFSLFAETDEYHEQMLAICKENNVPMRPGHVENYLANQFHLGRYQRGIEIFEQNKERLAANHLYPNLCLLCSFCYLFLRKTDEAIELLPPSANMTHTNALYSRMIYPIAYYIRGDAALACNEANNFKRTVKANTPSEESSLLYRTTQLLTQYFHIMIKDKYAQTSELPKLRETVQAAMSEKLTLDASEYAILWLAKELGISL